MADDEFQPIDGYVCGLLERARKKHGVKITLNRPTREERLEAALALHVEANGFYSMEIMVGRRVDSSESMALTFAFLRIAETMNPNPRRFYDGFAHQYWPENEKEKESSK